MKKIILCLLLFPTKLSAQVELHYDQNLSVTYEEAVAAYSQLAAKYPKQCALEVAGKGDNGREIYTFEIFPDRTTQVATILINNGIHAGEPDGIDASIEFAEKVLSKKLKFPSTRIVIIPMYNVDGSSNQSCCTRANQNGPLNQGFRANSRNLDLNRDFIKADASNTRTFYKIFQKFDPHVLIDNHVSNGSDYQYTMTLISSQADKLGTVLGSFLRNEFEPFLYEDMERKGTSLAPYVNTVTETPDSGIVEFLETPRFATGYAALFHCIGFVPETHMLKPYKQRVVATFQLMESMSRYVDENAVRFVTLKRKARESDLSRSKFACNWKLDQKKFKSIRFKGYTAGYKASEISGYDRLFYDRSKPYNKPVKFYNHYTAGDSVSKPKAFIIPQAWDEVIARLELNGIKTSRIERDTVIKVIATYIKSYESSSRPYEGHYLHNQTKVTEKEIEFKFFKGDHLIKTDQPGVRFLMETLSPVASDSYFNWNFFDSMLQQKEHYSDYVFEDTGAELLKNDPELRRKFEEKKASDAEFKASGSKQLNFIYLNSNYYEKTHMLYPVFKLND